METIACIVVDCRHLWVHASLSEVFRELGQHEAANEHRDTFYALVAAGDAGHLVQAQTLERTRYDLRVAMWREVAEQNACP